MTKIPHLRNWIAVKKMEKSEFSEVVSVLFCIACGQGSLS